MTPPALPCPTCGTPVVGARSFASGRGLLLEARHGLRAGYQVDPAGTASQSGRNPTHTTHDQCPGGWDVVVALVKGEAHLCPVGDSEQRLRAAIGPRTSGPAARLPAVLARLHTAGLRAHHTNRDAT